MASVLEEVFVIKVDDVDNMYVFAFNPAQEMVEFIGDKEAAKQFNTYEKAKEALNKIQPLIPEYECSIDSYMMDYMEELKEY